MSRWHSVARNILVGAGAYFVFSWAAALLSWLWFGLIGTVSYRGEWSLVLLSPIVENLPSAVCAAGAGAIGVKLFDSPHPKRWVLLPATLFVGFSFLSVHWAEAPGPLERLEQFYGAALVGAACLAGAHMSAAAPRSEGAA